MGFAEVTIRESVARLTLGRGKVNALNETVVRELGEGLRDLEADDAVRCVVLTGKGPFFSFGFDIPEFMAYPKQDFIRFLKSFSDLYRYLFLFPKPVVAALNGHTIAGGCMLSNACDHRVMIDNGARIALNEISFGASVFAGSVAILKHLVGAKNAEAVLFGGDLFTAARGLELGLVDRIEAPGAFDGAVRDAVERFSEKDPAAFAGIKRLLRRPVLRNIEELEINSIREFTDIWYSPRMRESLEKIRIRE